MLMKKAFLLILALCLLMTLVGCRGNPPDRAEKASDNAVQDQAREDGDIPGPLNTLAGIFVDAANLVGK